MTETNLNVEHLHMSMALDGLVELLSRGARQRSSIRESFGPNMADLVDVAIEGALSAGLIAHNPADDMYSLA